MIDNVFIQIALAYDKTQNLSYFIIEDLKRKQLFTLSLGESTNYHPDGAYNNLALLITAISIEDKYRIFMPQPRSISEWIKCFFNWWRNK